MISYAMLPLAITLAVKQVSKTSRAVYSEQGSAGFSQGSKVAFEADSLSFSAQWPFNIWASPFLTNYHFDKVRLCFFI